MQRVCKKFRIWGWMFLLLLGAAGALTFSAAAKEVQAAGFQVVGSDRYYIDSSGQKHKGWLTLNGNTYFFNRNTGAQRFERVKIGGEVYYFPKANNGVMAKACFQIINGKYFYFLNDGKMYNDGWISNSKKQWRYFGKNGVMYTGLRNVGGKRYYFYPNTGYRAVGVVILDGKSYYFDANGQQQKNALVKLGGQYYYFAKDTGELVRNSWVTFSKGQRYFGPTGLMYRNGYVRINGKDYYFDANGYVTAAFQKVGDDYYYLQDDGTYYKKGWLKIGNNTYYCNPQTGAIQKGWLRLDGKTYYFQPTDGRMVTGWATFTGGRRCFRSDGSMYQSMFKTFDKGKSTEKRYFFDDEGIAVTGWMTYKGYKYYFAADGVQQRGKYVTIDNNTYYFAKSSGRMITGWRVNAAGDKRYHDVKTGVMYKNRYATFDGDTYYFTGNGLACRDGWVKYNGQTRYFDPETAIMAVGIKAIDGKKYEFDKVGLLIGEVAADPTITMPSAARTIKNYLLGALQPVGQALYVWGGGWNDATRKGVSPTWKSFYDSQSSDYDFEWSNRDLSMSTRAKGLDCSGFVGWATYQVMHQTSGEGAGYTVVASDVVDSYVERGWGRKWTQAQLSTANYRLKPGDVGCNSGHTWIVIGQCADGSVVIVHSTPDAGCQIAGTPKPDGDYSGSQAIALAEQYMSKYIGYKKYDYHTSSGNYIRNGEYFRWSNTILSDPDGYLNRTADVILADLFK